MAGEGRAPFGRRRPVAGLSGDGSLTKFFLKLVQSNSAQTHHLIFVRLKAVMLNYIQSNYTKIDLKIQLAGI